MKLVYFNDYRLGVLKGDAVVDVTAVVQKIAHTGPGDTGNHETSAAQRNRVRHVLFSSRDCFLRPPVTGGPALHTHHTAERGLRRACGLD